MPKRLFKRPCSERHHCFLSAFCETFHSPGCTLTPSGFFYFFFQSLHFHHTFKLKLREKDFCCLISITEQTLISWIVGNIKCSVTDLTAEYNVQVVYAVI